MKHGRGTYAQPPLTAERRLDLAGAARLERAAAATSQPELRRLLAHASARRLARLLRSPTREPATGQPPVTASRRSATAASAGSGEPILRRRRMHTDQLLTLEVQRPEGLDYRPGQHLKMGVTGLLRSYSLVSAPHQPQLEFFVELYPGGRLSERLRTLPEGAPMALGKRPRGDLKVRSERVNQLLVATVTGIAPYVSMLRHHTRHGAPGHRFVVLHGASHADELGYAEELTALARRHPEHVHYVPTISRPDAPHSAGWRGATGRVEAHLAGVLERFGLTPVNTAAFACGNPGMVRNVADALRRDGYPVQTEPFD